MSSPKSGWCVRLLVGLMAAAGIAFPAWASAAEPVLLFNTLPIRADVQAEFLPVMQNNAQQTRKEPGNTSFDVFMAEDGDSTIYLFEQWQDQAALDAHMETPHLQAVAARAGSAMEPGRTESSIRLEKLSPDREPAAALPANTRNVIVTLHVDPDYRDRMQQALLDVVDDSRAAPGNLRYDVYCQVDDPNAFVVFERWASVEAHETHLALPYNAPLGQLLEVALTRPIADTRLLLEDAAPPDA